MLVQKRVDAITGYSFSSFLNLRKIGLPAEDINVMLMADYGLNSTATPFGEPGICQANPEPVKGFVKATIKGWQYAVAHPEESIQYLPS